MLQLEQKKQGAKIEFWEKFSKHFHICFKIYFFSRNLFERNLGYSDPIAIDSGLLHVTQLCFRSNASLYLLWELSSTL